MIKEEQYKINLHILEPCNFRCKHCFAHFDNKKILPVSHWKHIVDNCTNTIFTHEFNIAGGEPLLYPQLYDLVNYIYSIKCNCSIITNGFFMDEEWIKKFAPLLKTIGFSIDSFLPENLVKMGRCNSKKEYLTMNKFQELCFLIKKYNPKCNIKLNTVVTSINKTENLAKQIKEMNLPINKWKIIKMSVFKNETFDNSNLQISDNEYLNFVHSNLNEFEQNILETEQEIQDIIVKKIKEDFIIIAEKNVKSAYIMIDANGYLVDNSQNDNYIPLINCATENFIDGFNKLSFDKNLYFSRYKF